LSALAPPPVAPLIGAAVEQKTIAGITGNILTRGEYLPAVLGKMRVSPPLLANPYTRLINGDVFAFAIVGLFGQYTIANIKINGTAIEEFEDVTSHSPRARACRPTPRRPPAIPRAGMNSSPISNSRRTTPNRATMI
jgi:hypothetical protein